MRGTVAKSLRRKAAAHVFVRNDVPMTFIGTYKRLKELWRLTPWNERHVERRFKKRMRPLRVPVRRRGTKLSLAIRECFPG